MPSPSDIALAVQALHRRGKLTLLDMLLALRALAFVEQLAFIDDPSRRKAALCSRRAGKSIACVLLMLQTALLHPGVKVAYFAETRADAKDIVWSPKTALGGLLTLNERLCLGGVPNLSDLTLTFPNGSVIQCRGFNSSEGDIEKLRGKAFKLVIIDEAQIPKRADLSYSIDQVIDPALEEQDGAVILIGTPGSMPVGYFFEVTTGMRSDWSHHKWMSSQNPAMAAQYARKIASIDMMLAGNRREWLAEWVVDGSLACYPGFIGSLVTVPKLHDLSYGDTWIDVVGCDVGHHSALVWLRYSRGTNRCYVFDEWKEDGRSITDVALKVREWEAQNGKRFNRYIIDGAGKQSADEMRRHHGIPWEATNKAAELKLDCTNMMDADFSGGTLVMLAGRCPKLSKELSTLAWDEVKLRDDHQRELPHGADNHLSDALLYAWRECWHRRSDQQRLPQKPAEHDREQEMKLRDPEGFRMYQQAAQRAVEKQLQLQKRSRWGR